MGRPVSQARIAEMMSVDCEDVAEAVQALEECGLIRREWSSEHQAYMVTSA